jgi:hypothetical protein
MTYRILADVVLLVHWAIVAFVVLGLPMTIIGGWRRWAWVRSPWFRGLHLAAIGIVVLQTWLDVACPLTLLENHLRLRGGQGAYPGSCIGYWLHRMLFYEAAGWVFTLTYTAFGVAVLLTLIFVPPRKRRK